MCSRKGDKGKENLPCIFSMSYSMALVWSRYGASRERIRSRFGADTEQIPITSFFRNSILFDCR